MAQIEAELTARLYCTLALGFTGKSSSSLWLLELAEGGARGGETEERQQSASSQLRSAEVYSKVCFRLAVGARSGTPGHSPVS